MNNNNDENCCIICKSENAPIVWFGSLHFCWEDNALFEQEYLKQVLEPQLADAEPVLLNSSEKKRRTAPYLQWHGAEPKQ